MNRHISIRFLTVLLVLFSFAVVFFPTPTPVLAATDLYWVHTGGGSGNGSWSNISCWSATSGGAGGAGLPNSTFSVHFDNNSFSAINQTVYVNATANCLNMDFTGATNSPTLYSNGGSVYFYGAVTFIAAMNQTYASGGFAARGTAATSITTNGLTLNSPISIYTTYTGTLTINDNLTVNQGFTVNAASATLAMGNKTISCASWSYVAGTIAANTATINVSGTGAFTGGGATTYNNVNLNGTAHTISGNNTFVNLTRNGTAVKTDTLTLTSGSIQTVTGTCALIGNSATNRLLVQSSTLGSPATLHVTTDVAANWTGTNAVDFMDITSTHAIDLSAAGLNPAAYSGDCGGNTGITFTTSAAQTSASTDTWSTAAKWTSRVPLPQDDVTCSHNTTVDMPRIGRSITFTGTPTISLSNDINNYGSFTLVSGMTYTASGKNNYFRGRNTGMPVGGWTVTTAGQNLASYYFYAPAGTYKLLDTAIGGVAVILHTGTLDLNDVAVNTALFNVTYQTAIARVLYMRNSTITITSTASGNRWSTEGANNLTLYCGTSTIIMSNSGATGQTFRGDGLTYNNVTVQGAGAYALTISGNNTFNTFTVDRSVAAKTITLTAGSNQTVTNFVCAKSDARWLTINATAPATLTKAGGGALGFTYINLAQNTGSPATTWYYTPVSVIGANVTGWILDAPPTVVTIAPSVIGTTTATGRGNVTSLNFGGNINEQGIWYDVDSGVPYANSSNSTVDVGVGVFTQPIVGLTRSTLYYFRSHATNDDGYAEGVESTFLTKPVEPNTFTATTVNATAITASWTKGDGALNTYIRYSNVTYPATTVDGLFGYNGTLSTYTQTGLTDATVYYFRAWSWVANTTLSQYSDLYAGNHTLTSDPPQLATIPASNVEETTATTSATITYSPANYTVWGTQYGQTVLYGSWSNITGLSSTVPYNFNNNLAGLAKGDLYYFRGFAQNVAGIGYGSQLTFLTKPDEPTSLSVVNNPASSTLSWVKGTGALNTVIYGQVNSYPAFGSGTLVYNGTLATTSFVPPLSTETWYYRAWSLAQEGGLSRYSDAYAESSSQGRMNDFVRMLIVIVFLSCMIMGLLWVITSTGVSSNIIALMFTLVSFALIAFMGVAIINALL